MLKMLSACMSVRTHAKKATIRTTQAVTSLAFLAMAVAWALFGLNQGPGTLTSALMATTLAAFCGLVAWVVTKLA